MDNPDPGSNTYTVYCGYEYTFAEGIRLGQFPSIIGRDLPFNDAAHILRTLDEKGEADMVYGVVPDDLYNLLHSQIAANVRPPRSQKPAMPDQLDLDSGPIHTVSDLCFYLQDQFGPDQPLDFRLADHERKYESGDLLGILRVYAEDANFIPRNPVIELTHFID